MNKEVEIKAIVAWRIKISSTANCGFTTTARKNRHSQGTALTRRPQRTHRAGRQSPRNASIQRICRRVRLWKRI